MHTHPTHPAATPTVIQGIDVEGKQQALSATPRVADSLDNRTTMENRQTPEHYASKTNKEAATAIPS